MADYSQQVPAADRTLNLLEALAAVPEGLSAGELLQQLAMSRSALFALLNTLKARQYIDQTDARGRYRLGPALWSLMPGRQPGVRPLVEAFQSDEALSALSETAALLFLDRAETVLIAQREGQHTVRAVFTVGQRRSAPETAGGLALLAGLSPAELAQVGVDDGEITAVLSAVRRRGFARMTLPETVELARPVCPDGARPVAALLVSIPRFRSSEALIETQDALLRQAAARLSYRLGAAVYQPYGWAVAEPIGPNRPLTSGELAQFLQGAWGARLACVRQDGTPHVLPLWYEWDGEAFWVAASPGAQWPTYVRDGARSGGQVSLTIDEPWPPLRRVFVAGWAEFVPETAVAGGLAGLRRRLATRYLGQGAGEQEELSRTDGWQAVRIQPQRISGRQGLGRA